MTPKLIIGNKNYSSWSLRAWLLLRVAGIEFVEQRIALNQADTAKNLAAATPAMRVPVLVLGQEIIWDSLAIAETLAERYPDAKLWPDDPAARAHARCISAEMHSGFETLRSRMPMNCRAMGRKVSLPEELTRDIDRIFEIWSDCHERYSGGWLFGRFSIADAMYAPVVMRFRTYGINLPDSAYPFADRLMKSEAMQEWILDSEGEVEVIEEDEAGQ